MREMAALGQSFVVLFWAIMASIWVQANAPVLISVLYGFATGVTLAEVGKNIWKDVL